MSRKNEYFAEDKASLNEKKIETIIVTALRTTGLVYVNLLTFILFRVNRERCINLIRAISTISRAHSSDTTERLIGHSIDISK